MQIADKHVVSIHYTLTNDAKEVLDSSRGQEPLVYLQGTHQIIPGLENAMLGRKAGDRLTVNVEAEHAYGTRDDRMVQTVPRDAFQGAELEIGSHFTSETEVGPISVIVTRIEADEITVDGNHPLAGVRLTFDVEVVSVRTATAEELSHGHVHGAGGHHH